METISAVVYGSEEVMDDNDSDPESMADSTGNAERISEGNEQQQEESDDNDSVPELVSIVDTNVAEISKAKEEKREEKIVDVDNTSESVFGTTGNVERISKTDEENEKKEMKKLLRVKKEKRGVLYFSFIPPGINVQKMREIFGEFGEVTNIYLQPEKRSQRKNGKVRNYSEGWLEMRRKKIAKQIALMLNGQQVGGKRRNPYYDSIWSIKYLHRFKWSHLREQLIYEKALRDQRLRFEVGQAKKEADFYINMHEEYKRRKRKREEDNEEALKERDKYYRRKQRKTDEEIRNQKNEAIEGVDVELLKKIFS